MQFSSFILKFFIFLNSQQKKKIQLQSQTSDITLTNQQAQGLQRQADSRNRQLIEQDNLQLNRLWQELISSLEQRRDNLQTVADKWDDFENKLLSWEKALGRLSDKFRNVDPVVRSRRHLEDTKHAIQVSVQIINLIFILIKKYSTY